MKRQKWRILSAGFLPGKIKFAIDNVRIKTDTADGKNQLHSTVIAAYQKIQSSVTVESTVGLEFIFLETVTHKSILP